MQNVFSKSIAIYLSTLWLNAGFAIFIILSLLFLPMIAGYVNVGGNFIRFSSLYTPDMTALQAVALFGIAVVGLLCTAFFLSAIISIVKLRETLDHFGFSKVIATFPKYIGRIFAWLG